MSIYVREIVAAKFSGIVVKNHRAVRRPIKDAEAVLLQINCALPSALPSAKKSEGKPRREAAALVVNMLEYLLAKRPATPKVECHIFAVIASNHVGFWLMAGLHGRSLSRDKWKIKNGRRYRGDLRQTTDREERAADGDYILPDTHAKLCTNLTPPVSWLHVLIRLDASTSALV